MTDEQGGREHRHEIEIDAPLEAVWQAISDPEDLTRWYVLEARVDPESGSYWVSRGGETAAARIEAWDPPRRLRLVEEWEGDNPPAGIVEEWTVEARGGRAVLRLVHSGIPDSPTGTGSTTARTAVGSCSCARCGTTWSGTPGSRGGRCC